MAFDTGQLDRLVELERSVAGELDDYNVARSTWQVVFRMWARRRDVRDGERDNEAGQLAGATAARFLVWSSIEARTITTADRLRHDDRIWQIVGVKESTEGETGELIEITAQWRTDPEGDA